MAQALDFGKIKDSCSNLTSLAGNMGATADTLESASAKVQAPAWEGKASEAFRDKMKTLVAHMPEANRQLAEAVIFLASCADAYDQLSNEAVKKLKDLIGGQEYIDKYDVDKAPSVNLDSRYGQEEPQDTTPEATPKQTGCGNKGCSGCGGGCSSRGGGCGGGCSSRGGGCGGGTPVVTPGTTALETTPAATDVTSLVKALDCTDIDLDKASAETKKLFEDKNFKYDKDGFAKLGEYYLIECDASVGKIGDVIKFTLSDGTAVSCIVAANTKDAKDKDKIKFIMQKDKMSNAKETEIIKRLLSKANKIENTGPYNKTANPTPGGIKTRGNVIDVSAPVTNGPQYGLSDDDIAYLAYVAKREQGSVAGSKIELSLMANLYEKNKNKYSSVVDYVKNSGWFSSRSTSSYTNPGADYVNAAKEVLNDGKRYLPTNVVEHDCLSDITSISTGNPRKRSDYIPGQTVIHNRYGATYLFQGFAPNDGDPFGNLV